MSLANRYHDYIAPQSESPNQQEQNMDQPIRKKTEAEIEADRLAEERDRIDQLRQWDRHSALAAVVGEREAAAGADRE